MNSSRTGSYNGAEKNNECIDEIQGRIIEASMRGEFEIMRLILLHQFETNIIPTPTISLTEYTL